MVDTLDQWVSDIYSFFISFTSETSKSLSIRDSMCLDVTGSKDLKEKRSDLLVSLCTK